MNSFVFQSYTTTTDTNGRVIIYLSHITKHPITLLEFNAHTVENIRHIEFFIGDKHAFRQVFETEGYQLKIPPHIGFIPVRYPDFCDYRIVIQYNSSAIQTVPEFKFAVKVNEVVDIPPTFGKNSLCINDYVSDQYINEVEIKKDDTEPLKAVQLWIGDQYIYAYDINNSYIPLNIAPYSRFVLKFIYVDESILHTPYIQIKVKVGPALNLSPFTKSIDDSPKCKVPFYISMNEKVLIDHSAISAKDMAVNTYNCSEGCVRDATHENIVFNCIVFDGKIAYKKFQTSKCECAERIESAKEFIRFLELKQ